MGAFKNRVRRTRQLLHRRNASQLHHKIDKHGRHAAPWYLPDGPLVTGPRGYLGLASTCDVLLANDNKGGTGGEIHRFDMRDPKGRPVVVPRTPNVFISDANGIYMPPKYRGTMLLVGINTVGVIVLRSQGGTWRTAEHLGGGGHQCNVGRAGCHCADSSTGRRECVHGGAVLY